MPKALSGTWHRRPRPQPANAGLERPHLPLRNLTSEGRHPNRLAIDEEANHRVGLEPLRSPTKTTQRSVGEEPHAEVHTNLLAASVGVDGRKEECEANHSFFARTTSVPFIPAWREPQYSEHVMSNAPAWSATNSTVTASPVFGIRAFTPNALIARP